MRTISGIQSTGNLHLGNYFSMIKPMIDLQNTSTTTKDNNNIILFIADYHTLNANFDQLTFKNNSINMIIDCLACGVDPNKIIFFRQSDVNYVTELTWILSCITPVNLLKRCHSYKDKINHGFNPNCGLFMYPILMSADILLYDSDIVLVGRDQVQHIEITRDIAIKFNNFYNNNIFKIPRINIIKNIKTVLGIDGQKMSKSYNNTLDVFEEDSQKIKKAIFNIVTDSKKINESKNPEDCVLFSIYKLIASPSDVENIRDIYLSGNFMYKDVKEKLYHAFMDYFHDARCLRNKIKNNIDYINDVLKFGSNRANAIANAVIKRVKSTVGLI